MKCWGDKICEKFQKKDFSHIIYILPRKIKVLENYKHMEPWKREKEIKGAFKIKKNMRASLKKKKLLILDDVCTTGSQISELAYTLGERGVSEVYALVIGKTIG